MLHTGAAELIAKKRELVSKDTYVSLSLGQIWESYLIPRTIASDKLNSGAIVTHTQLHQLAHFDA